MQANKIMRKIEDINSVGIEIEARRQGLCELEFIGKFWHPGHPESNDWAIEIYQFPGGAKVAATNGNPIWEESDFEIWEEMMVIYGIE
jgi:hypothetical protein